MEIIKQTKIDFMGKKNLALILSALLIVIAIGSMVSRGLNFGLDYRF